MGEAKRNRMDAGYVPPARWTIKRRIVARRTVTEDDLRLFPRHGGMLHLGNNILLNEMAEVEIDDHTIFVAITHGVPSLEQRRTMVPEDAPACPVEWPDLGATLNGLGQLKLLALMEIARQAHPDTSVCTLLQHLRVGGATRPVAYKLHKFLRRAPPGAVVAIVTDDVDAVAAALGWLSSTAPVTEVCVDRESAR